MRILILEVTESDNVILEDVFELLSDLTGIRVVDLSHEAKSRINLEQQVLTFSDFEIRVREQAVYKNGVFIPMSHYEFLPSAIWQNILAGYSASNRYMRQSGIIQMEMVMPPLPI